MPLRIGGERTVLTFEWLDRTESPPECLVAAELVFFVQLARLGTRTRIQPLRVTALAPPSPASPFTDYFGVPVERAES